MSNCSEEKYFLQRKRTPSFLEADFAIFVMCSLQDKLDATCTPKILIELRGSISLSSKVRTISGGVEEREMGINCVLEALKLTRLSVPHWEMLTKSEFKESERVVLD